MAVQCYRNMAAVFILVNLMRTVKPHVESSSSDVSAEILARQSDTQRSQASHMVHYKGLPIELPNRRDMSANEIIQPMTWTSRSAAPYSITSDKVPYPTPIVTGTSRSAAPYSITSDKVPYPPLNRRFRRIYNPDEVAAIEDNPFMAALLVNSELWCGGVIIDKDKVLTAAHCLQLQYNNRFFREYVKMLTVRVGSSNATAGGEVLRVTEIFFHPNYKPQTLEFNFAVVKLHRNLTFGSRDISIEEIPYSTDKAVPVDNDITFLGWGSVLGVTGAGGTGQVLLQRVKLPVYDISDCQEIYGRDLVTRTNFCAGFITLSKNVCNHDAGGPAIMDNALIGILSFSSKRCDQADQPAVFSTVGVVASWLGNLGNKRVQLRNTAIKSPEMAAIE